MTIIIKILFTVSIISSLGIAQSYLILKNGNSFFVPIGSQFCSDNIIVEAGASYITENISGTCENAVVTGQGVIVLPVELISFTAKAVMQNHVLLRWETATEVNNYGFAVERTSEVGGWTNIGFVQGHGNSNSPQNYSFEDKNLLAGSKFKYRLKQIDTDSKFVYSSIIEIELIPREYVLYQNYPNPFNPTTTILLGIPSKGNVRLSVLNILGEEIRVLLNEERESGYCLIDFSGSDLPSGVYYYRIQVHFTESGAENFIYTKKMLLLK